MRYTVSYDLNAPGKDYKGLTDALKTLGASKLLYSEWILRHRNSSSTLIRDYLWQFMDANDRLFVACLDSSDWASMRAMTDPNTI